MEENTNIPPGQPAENIPAAGPVVEEIISSAENMLPVEEAVSIEEHNPLSDRVIGAK